MSVPLKPFQTGLAMGALGCFLLSAAALGLTWVMESPVQKGPAVVFGSVAVVLAVLGGTLWVRMTVLEAAFRVWEEIREGRPR